MGPGQDDMKRTLPDGCPRNLRCEPLSRLESDDGSTFICCGWPGVRKDDPYRFCFKSVETDTMYDYDEVDLLDTILVATEAMSNARRSGRVTDTQGVKGGGVK